MSFAELVANDRSWRHITIFAESVPHFFHQDLALLWVLERHQDIRPEAWEGRVAQWKRLIELLLLGSLDLSENPINAPLSRYANPVDFTQCGLGRCRTSTQPIAVLSPITLIRSLPEPRATELLVQLPAPPAEYAPLLPRLLLDLVTRLEASGSRFGKRLAAVLRSEFAAEMDGGQRINVAMSGSSYRLRLLQSSDRTLFARKRGKQVLKPQYVPVEIQLLRIVGEPSFVPLCTGCGKPLTTGEPVPVHDADKVILHCVPCNLSQPVRLDKFLIWRDVNKVFVWTDREKTFPKTVGLLPPVPAITGIDVKFEWPNFETGIGNANTLTLRFPNSDVGPVRFEELTYRKLIVPGSLEKFRGLPFRPNWLHALTSVADVLVSGPNLVLKGLKLRGVPEAFDYRWPGFSVEVRKDLQLGHYPIRQNAAWKRYRFFAGGVADDARVGTVGAGFEVSTPSGVAHEVRTGWPIAAYLENAGGSAGASWLLPDAKPSQNETGPNIYVGVDFGTTQSVVYHGQKDNVDEPDAPLDWESIISAASLIAGLGKPATPFLPETPAESVESPTLIPSAVWLSEGTFHGIRWRRTPPSGTAKAAHSFKWDRNLSTARGNRQAFLDELMFVSLGALASKYGGGETKVNWRIGFAYPIAFSHTQRRNFKEDLEALKKNINTYAPGNSAAEMYHLSESFACVRGVGHKNPGESFLFADLGGGTLDVDLFTALPARDNDPEPVEHHQIGSVRVGGEVYVQRLTRRLGDDEDTYWRVRDAIESGRASVTYASEEKVPTFAGDYLPIPLEVLRVMAAAYRQAVPEGKLEYVLAGNGWKIATLLKSSGLAAPAAMKRLDEFIASFKIPGLKPMAAPLVNVPDAKHLVALGALRNAKNEQRRDLDSDAVGPNTAAGSKMPAGLKCVLSHTTTAQVSTIDWYQLLGDAAKQLDMLGVSRNELKYEFDRSLCPSASAEWASQLRRALPNFSSYPSNDVVADEFKLNIINEWAEKAPLVIVLERSVQPMGEKNVASSG